MIKDLKLCVQVSKYGLNRNGNIFCGMLFLLLGVFMSLVFFDMTISYAYVAIGALMGQQLIQSVAVPAMVQSSPKKKMLETRLPVLFATVIMLFTHSLMILTQLIFKNVLQHSESAMSNAILLGCGMYVIIGIYMASAMKLMVPASVIFFIVFMAYHGVTMDLIADDVAFVPLGTSVAISYAVILLVGCIMYLINLATYRLPYSRKTWETALKRASK